VADNEDTRQGEGSADTNADASTGSEADAAVNDNQNPFAQTVPPPPQEADDADPLLSLIERVKADGRAVYAARVLDALCALEDSDPGQFAQLRWQLIRECDVVSDLLRNAMHKARAAAKKREKDAAGPRLTDVQLLISLGTTDVLLFHNPRGMPFADYKIGKNIVTGLLADHGPGSYGGWLRMAFYRATGSAPSNEAMTSAINTLQVKALHDGQEIAIFPRIGWFEDKIYIDRGTPDWSVIEVDRDGWRIIDRAPVRFIRSEGTEPLPLPMHGGRIEQFRELFTNLATEDDFVLTIGWVAASFNPDGGYPILGAFGPYDSAKTTLLRGCRRLIDPNQLDTRTLPSSERDLMVIAQTSWVQSFDNVSSLTPEMSDVFCRLSTGAAYGTRKLYTDTGEIILTARRPAAFTGIVEVIEQPDLVDRTFFVTTIAIPKAKRLSEKKFWAKFNEAWPEMLGAVLDAVSCALRHRDDDQPADLPRMADATVWISAAERAFGWKPGTFLAAYRVNIQHGARTAVESDVVGAAIIAFMSSLTSAEADTTGAQPCRSWRGTATELLSKLRETAGEGAVHSKGWPKTPSVLGKTLPPLVPALAKVGICLTISPSRTFQRQLQISWLDDTASTAASEASSQGTEFGPGQDRSPLPDATAKISTDDCIRTEL
jgi:hypothetical protein